MMGRHLVLGGCALILVLCAPATAGAQEKGCKREAFTSTGGAKFRPFTRKKELAGEGAAMAAARAIWERDVAAKYGDAWKVWDNSQKVALQARAAKAGEADWWRCAPAKEGKIASFTIHCTVSARPCMPGGAPPEQQQATWILLGERAVSLNFERDYINVGQSDDRIRSRSFGTLRFEVQRANIQLASVRITYVNGYSEEFKVNADVKAGGEVTVPLGGERSHLKRIDMTYRSRGGASTERVLIRVSGGRLGPGSATRQQR